jgi:hypothetical protein
VRFAKHDHVVKTFATDRADESLNVSILPGRSDCDRTVPNAHCTDPLQEDGPYDVSRSRMRYRGAWSHENASVTWREIQSAVGFAVTPNDTQSCRPWRTMTRQYRIWNAIVGRTKRSIAAMPVDVIAEKRSPARRRWPWVAAHVPSDRRLEPSLSNSP